MHFCLMFCHGSLAVSGFLTVECVQPCQLHEPLVLELLVVVTECSQDAEELENSTVAMTTASWMN